MTARLPPCLLAPAVCPPGAEPVAEQRGSTGLLVLHGFTGSPWEVRPLCDAALGRGWSVAAPVLAGHATRVAALDHVRWQDWMADAQAALAWLAPGCATVHVAGFSMGGLLAALLADSAPAVTGKIALLAPAFALRPVERWAIDGLHALGLGVVLGKSDPKLPDGTRPPAYHAVPMRGARQLALLIDYVTAQPRPLRHPVLHLHGRRDLTIACSAVQRAVRATLGGHVQQATVGGGHLMLRDRDAGEALRLAMDFLAG